MKKGNLKRLLWREMGELSIFSLPCHFAPLLLAEVSLFNYHIIN